MRTFQTILIACLLTFAVPAVAADDPSYEIPNPIDLAAAAGSFAENASAAVTGLGAAAHANATDAVSDGENQTFPGSRVAGVAGGAGNAGSAAAGAAGRFADAAKGWALERAENKSAEAFGTVDAGIGVAIAVIGAGDQIAGAAVGVVCGDQLVNDVAQDECGSGSLVNATREQVQGFGNDTAQRASADRTGGLVAAVKSFLGNLVGLPEN